MRERVEWVIGREPHPRQTPPSAARHGESRRHRSSPVELGGDGRDDLAPHTRNRRLRFKSCGKCFRASRALEWARKNIDPDEEVAVGRLNELVDLGLLMLVVDPSKRFEAGESRALYLRTVDSVLDAEMTNVST